MSHKKCSKCNAMFECSNEKEGCWCEELTIDLAILKTLEERYANCLCPVCLKGYSVKKEK